jgi:2-dehydropantoate 2-reductase
MKALVYGAGVIGTVYAAFLHRGGHNVSILARGRRLADIREHGVQLEEAATGKRMQAGVPAVEQLEPEDSYDLVLVAMQRGQIAPVLPILASNRGTPTVLFLGNNASGPAPLTGALGAERVLMGFPDFGGHFDGPVVRYARQGGKAGRVGLTVGEIDGRMTPRLRSLVQALASARIDVDIAADIDAWLKGHVALVAPILFALRRHGYDNLTLADDRATLSLMTRAVREGLAALRALGHAITPFKLKTLAWMPTPLAVLVFSKIIGSDFARVAFAGHARTAAGEFEILLDELSDLTERSGLATPALDELCEPRPQASSSDTR